MRSDFDSRFRRGRMIISLLGAVIALMVLMIFGTVFYLGITCYNSNDPNSMACYMLTPRVTVVDP